MKIFDIFKSTEDNNKNNEDIIENVVEDSLPEVEPEEEEKISYYDEFGKEHIVEKKKWVEKKLNPDIRKNWDNVEALYPIVLDAFSKGAYAEVQEACLRIYSMDKDKERKTNILGTYYIKTGAYDRAIEMYKKYLSSETATESIYVNYATALEGADRTWEAESIYLRALKLNPNSVAAFRNYFKLIRRKGTKEYLKQLEKFSSERGSWRAKLTLATDYFKRGDKDNGNIYLRDALRESSYNAETMAVASGIYSMNHLFEELEQYVFPFYIPEKHGAYTTLNILEYYKVKKDYKKGLELCKFTSKYSWPEFFDKFIAYEDEFLRIRSEVEQNEQKEGGSSFFSTNYPLWYYNFNEPNWLLNNSERGKPNLLVLSFTALGEQSDFAENLAVSLPLQLNETLHYKTNLNYQVAIYHNKDKIFVSRKKYSVDYINLIKKQNPKLDYVLSGNIMKVPNSYEKYDIEIYLYDYANEAKVRLVNKIYEQDELYQVQNDMFDKFNEFFKCLNKNHIKYENDYDNLILFSQKLKFLMTDERNKEFQAWRYKKLFIDQIKVVLNDQKNDLKKINLIVLLYELKKYNSQLLKGQKPLIYDMIYKEIFKTPTLKLLTPIIYNVYNDEENYNSYMEELQQNSPIYIKWINKFLDYVN
jgi:putative tetratricopeptide repeat-containing domain protein